MLLRHEVASGCASLSNASSAGDSGCDWRNLSVRAVFDRSPPGRFPRAQFYNDEVLTDWLTVKGWTGSATDGFESVWEENGSVLGWTCGNLVAPAIEAARFFFDLLSPRAPHAILGAGSVQEMKRKPHMDLI